MDTYDKFRCPRHLMYGTYKKIELCARTWQSIAKETLGDTLMSVNNIIYRLITKKDWDNVKQFLSPEIMLLVIDAYTHDRESMINKFLKMLFVYTGQGSSTAAEPTYMKISLEVKPDLNNYYKLYNWYSETWQFSLDPNTRNIKLLFTGPDKLRLLIHHAEKHRYKSQGQSYLIINQDGSILFSHSVHKASGYYCIKLKGLESDYESERRPTCNDDDIEVQTTNPAGSKIRTLDLRYRDLKLLKDLHGFTENKLQEFQVVNCSGSAYITDEFEYGILKYGKRIMESLLQFRYLYRPHPAGQPIPSNIMKDISKTYCGGGEYPSILNCFSDYIVENIYNIELNLRHGKYVN